MSETQRSNSESHTSAPLNQATIAAKPSVNKALWRALFLPSLILLAFSIAAYALRPLRDEFLSGQAQGNYFLFSFYSVASPYFWIGGVAALVFFVMLLVSIIRTVARREWGYWQRIFGLIALTVSGIMFGLTGLPEFGVSSRDAGSVTYGNYNYHLFVQTIPVSPSTVLRMNIFVCDPTNLSCQRFHRADIEYLGGERVPPLDQMRIQLDGIFVVVRSNSPTVLTKIQP